MMKIVILLSICIALAIAAAPPAPVVSENFQARIKYEVQNNTHYFNGDGDEGNDYDGNRAAIHAESGDGPNRHYVFQLARYDLGELYTIDSFNLTDCENQTITGHLPYHWAWLANATFNGTDNHNVSRWTSSETPTPGLVVHLTAGFFSNAPNVPLFFSRSFSYNNNFERTTISYYDFFNKTDPNFFNVPKSCGGSGNLYLI